MQIALSDRPAPTPAPSVVPFNKPYLSGNELRYIAQAVESGKISGDGMYSRLCHTFFEKRYGIARALLTTSCTDALEMAALLLDIKPGDEVIMPAYTFVSTANAFALRGAVLVFADSLPRHPNIDARQIEALITPRTRAIVVVHYAGVACDMDTILDLANRHGIAVVEDAAQAIESFHHGRQLGTLGALGTFSFHETKNIISGEGGLLAVNDASLAKRAEIIREKGTNRASFFRGEVDKYGWHDVGSSFLPSDIIAAYLYAQLEKLEDIQARRRALWDAYDTSLRELEAAGRCALPQIPAYATNNAHIFYLVCASGTERDALIDHLRRHAVQAVFHYTPLHRSPYYAGRHGDRILPNCETYAARLVRLPLYYELTSAQHAHICQAIRSFYA